MVSLANFTKYLKKKSYEFYTISSKKTKRAGDTSNSFYHVGIPVILAYKTSTEKENYRPILSQAWTQNPSESYWIESTNT